MFDELCVAENVFMGHMPGGAVRRLARRCGRGRKRCSADRGGLRPPTRRVKRLSVAQKHMVEIARALSHDARVVIMDEPTAALSRHEIDELFRHRRAAEGGGPGDPLHQPQVRRDFRGLPTAGSACATARKVGEGLTAGDDRAGAGAADGRAADRPGLSQARRSRSATVVLTVDGLSNATEFADVASSCAKRRDPGVLRPGRLGRSEAMQCLFGLSRPTRGAGDAGGPGGRLRRPGRGDRGRHRLRAGGPAAAGRDAAARGAGEHDARDRWPTMSRHRLLSRASER